MSVGVPGRVLHRAVGSGAPGVRGREPARVDGEPLDVHQNLGLAAAGPEKLEPTVSTATSARVRTVNTESSFERVAKNVRRSH
jgi:hypothetical protein